MSDAWGLAVSGVLAGVGWIAAWTGQPSLRRTVAGVLFVIWAAFMNGWFLRGVTGP